ncbi:MAG: response regulator, partial [Agathobacter sp.]|nr:response regulator [Agathobacter sp.]
MRKVLIADDEKNICLMLQKLIPWNQFDLELIGMVHNGNDALAAIEAHRPDIVISDIRMPGHDGLEIVQITRERNYDIDFVIISGYKYFEYAHKALSLGVEHYLLKPIDKNELVETLEKIMKKRQIHSKQAEEAADLKQQVRNTKRAMQTRFLNDLMSQEGPMQNLELEEVNERAQTDFKNGCFRAICAKIDVDTKEKDVEALLRMVEECIEDELQDGDKEYINSSAQSVVITVLNYKPEQKEELFRGIEKLCNRVRKELDKFHGYHFTVGVGKEKASIAESKHSIQEALKALKCRGKKGVDKTIFYEELSYGTEILSEVVDESQMLNMSNVVESLDYHGIYDEIRNGVLGIMGIANYNPILIYAFYEKMAELILSVLRNNQIEEEIVLAMEEELKIAIDMYYNLTEMGYQFSEIIRRYFEKISNERKNRSQLPIRRAKQYIEDNYQRQLSLEEVAEAIELSPAYLSTVFYKETGIHFSEYLISCRVEAAKELLKSTGLSIAEVAQQVGYTDSRHFSKT